MLEVVSESAAESVVVDPKEEALKAARLKSHAVLYLVAKVAGGRRGRRRGDRPAAAGLLDDEDKQGCEGRQ